MSRADLSDPAITEAINDLKNSSTPTNWILLGYVPKSDSKIKVVDSGSGGLKEVVDQVNDGRVLFALVSFEINRTRKFVYVAWCGEGVVGMKKGLFNNHANDIGFLFKGFHVQINARSEDDLNEQLILEKLTKASGASYDSGAKNQGQVDLVPTSVAQGRNAATRSNAQAKTADKSDYQKQQESQQFWNQTRATEDSEKQQQKPNVNPRTDYNKTQEREQFWAQQKQDQSTNAPAPNRPQVAPGAGTARARFENAAQQSQQAPSRPPPQQRPPPAANKPPVSAPPPVKAAPPPVVQPEPEPEPVPEPVQEAEPQQEEYSGGQEEQAYQDQSQETYGQTEEQSYQASEDYAQQEQPPAVQEDFQQATEETYQDQSYQDQSYQDQSQPSGGLQARALYDYDAENPDDLSFKEGETINVLDNSDPSGWWEGEINGVSGFFPSNFCELIQ